MRAYRGEHPARIKDIFTVQLNNGQRQLLDTNDGKRYIVIGTSDPEAQARVGEDIPRAFIVAEWFVTI